MSRTIYALRPEKTISKFMITFWATAIIAVFIIGFWASEVRGSLYYGAVENFPYLLIPAALFGTSLTATAIIILCTEEKFSAHDTWCMLLMFWAGMSFGSWFVSIDIRMGFVEFCLLALGALSVGCMVALVLVWKFKFWILGVLCLTYFIFKGLSLLITYWNDSRARRKRTQLITEAGNVTPLSR